MTTNVAESYRPIALLNIMYKLYTSCINSLLTNHLLRNNIITPEQGGGKQGEQQNNSSLMNQSLMMLEEITKT